MMLSVSKYLQIDYAGGIGYLLLIIGNSIVASWKLILRDLFIIALPAINGKVPGHFLSVPIRQQQFVLFLF